VPPYITFKSAAATGVAVPFSEYEHAPVTPLVVQENVEPFNVPLPVPVTGTPTHVAV